MKCQRRHGLECKRKARAVVLYEYGEANLCFRCTLWFWIRTKKWKSEATWRKL